MKSLFEKELIAGMQSALIKQASDKNFDNFEQAVDSLNKAAAIFDDIGMLKQSDQILMILKKIANDPHTQGLTSEKMVENIKDHGFMLNLSDDCADLLKVEDDEDFLFEDED